MTSQPFPSYSKDKRLTSIAWNPYSGILDSCLWVRSVSKVGFEKCFEGYSLGLVVFGAREARITFETRKQLGVRVQRRIRFVIEI
jgi:hypothetical protein